MSPDPSYNHGMPAQSPIPENGSVVPATTQPTDGQLAMQQYLASTNPGVALATSDDAAAEEPDDESEFDEVWISKAKEIVSQTRSDPYRQSRAISKLKADYLKARYNKDIKVSEDSAS